MSTNHATDIRKTISRDGDQNAVVVKIEKTGAANTDYPVQHGLGRVPVGCQVILSDKAINVYRGAVWTAETIYLRFSAADANVNIRIW